MLDVEKDLGPESISLAKPCLNWDLWDAWD
jgi:hypothetical protein